MAKVYPALGIKRITVHNTNGRIDFIFEDVTEIAVHAEKIVKAGTQEAAKEYAEEIKIEIELT